MYEVTCPVCQGKRTVSVWHKKDGDAPYIKNCKSCSQTGKKLTEETKDKLRKAKPEGFGDKVSQQHKEQPELKSHLIAGAGAGWNSGQTGKVLSEETKEKIAEAMKGKNKK